MDITEKIYFPMETLRRLENLSKLDKNTVNTQLEIAIDSYLLMRDLPNGLQKVILDLLKDPLKYKLDNGFVKSLETLSEKDKTTAGVQVEKAIKTYLSIRSLPEKAETEILDLISHHENRNVNGK